MKGYPRNMNRLKIFKDIFAGKLVFCLTVVSGLVVFFMALGLYLRARFVLAERPLRDLLFSSNWRPLRGDFGFLPFIAGTIWVTVAAVIIAVPICILVSLYLSEYAGSKVRERTMPVIDLLAGIPSIVYGVWGVLVIVPLVKDHIAPMFGVYSTGYSVLSAGIVLAIMIMPIIIHVATVVLESVPDEMRAASLALGATCWQTTKHVVLRRAMPGVIAAVVLGISRAFGETMAVLMVAGNVARIPSSVFDPAYPLPALIANNYGEMLSIPLYDSAMLFAALLLFVIVLLFNFFARIILIKVERAVQ